jgi:N-acetylmuramoyl-L-alanine amidase
VTSVRNAIAECARGDELERADLLWIVVHHTGLARLGLDNPSPIRDVDLDGPRLAAAFRGQHLLGTGRRVPYHVLIRYDGKADQMLPLAVRGAHARGYNATSIALAYVGETGGPNPAQYATLLRLCRAVLVWGGSHVKIVGHTDLPDASRDPAKVCPGPGLSVPALSATILDHLPDEWHRWDEHARSLALISEGLVVEQEAA